MMAWLDAALVTAIVTAAAALLVWRLGRRPPSRPSSEDVIVKGALGEGLARLQKKRGQGLAVHPERSGQK